MVVFAVFTRMVHNTPVLQVCSLGVPQEKCLRIPQIRLSPNHLAEISKKCKCRSLLHCRPGENGGDLLSSTVTAVHFHRIYHDSAEDSTSSVCSVRTRFYILGSVSRNRGNYGMTRDVLRN